jgi:hypothetical protein
MLTTKFGSAVLAAVIVIAAHQPLTAARKKDADPKKSAASADVLDAFEKASWQTHQAEGASISLKTASGVSKKALQVTYDLKDTKAWVQISKALEIGDIRDKALRLWVRGEGASNTLEIKLVDEDGTNFGVKKASATAQSEWTELVLNEDDFEYWWGGDPQLGPVKEIYIAISAGEGGAGQVWLDDLRRAAAKAAVLPKDGVLDQGESTEGWIVSHADGATASLSVAQGPTGQDLALDYSIPQNQWVAVRRKIRFEFSPNDVFLFRLKGTGDPNNLELKLVDKNDSAFGKVIPAFQGDWRDVRVPMSDFRYLWGPNQELDPSKIVYLDIAVSGPGGKGQVLLDRIQVVR